MTNQIIASSRSTSIEWTEHTWNPFVGCNIHTAGCTNCYAMQQAYRVERFGTVPHYEGIAKKVNGKRVWTGRVNRASDRAMNKPLGIKRPSMIFVNSMSDFFHPEASDEWRLEAIAIMNQRPDHVFQVLTKRAEEMQPFLDRTGISIPDNMWTGVTVEHAKTTYRIGLLREIPVKTRFISFEPLIGSVGDVDLSDIHWAISGGESGGGARHCNADWVRGIRDQCVDQGVAFFHKQWGHWSNNPIALTAPDGIKPAEWVKQQDPEGKGGSLIDGKHWKQWPTT